jgi:rhamnosyltransferase
MSEVQEQAQGDANMGAPRVLVVIPTYRPSEQLLELITDIRAQGYPILISDDASPVTADAILRSCSNHPDVHVIRHHRNEGIARALNEGLLAAIDMGAEFLLTLDQDSRVPANYVNDLVRAFDALSVDRVGVIAPAVIADSSGDITYPTHITDGVMTTEEVIQSGALWKVTALEEIHGFDEKLGIDAVDAAACLHLRETGHLVALTPAVTLQHNLGDSRQVKLFGRSIMVTNHSPARRATMVRNRLALAPAEFKQSPRHAFRTVRRVTVNSVLGAVLGKNRMANAKGSVAGLLPKKDQN